MSNSHRIEPVPSIDLQRKWLKEVLFEEEGAKYSHVMTKAAQWGYWQHRNADKAALQKARDEELEAIVHWLVTGPYAACITINPGSSNLIVDLRNARRSQPLSLREQGLASLDEVIKCLKALVPGAPVDGIHIETIRRALEHLREPEENDG